MMRKNLLLMSLMVLPVVLASGCAKRSTLGDAIAAQGAEIAAIGDKWTAGDELIEEGEDQIERGNDMISNGRKLISTGEKNIQRGKVMKTEAEDEYKTRTGNALPTP